jgi:hypothetical protein
LSVLQPNSLDVSSSDVYLQPHSDDICFSLGAFVWRRHRGILLTAFPISGYVPLRPDATRPSVDWVTGARVAEDRAFAEQCGLHTEFLELPDSAFLGHHPFDLSRVEENLQRVKSSLLGALLSTPPRKPSSGRPWLFCPSGIGGHVDHVAIRMLVNQNHDRISRQYCIGFYEDLHYASSADTRIVGINNLLQDVRGRQLHRYVFPFAKDIPRKLALIQLYKSQFLTMPRSIERFTPAVGKPSAPHEAIWSHEPAGPLVQSWFGRLRRRWWRLWTAQQRSIARAGLRQVEKPIGEAVHAVG